MQRGSTIGSRPGAGVVSLVPLASNARREDPKTYTKVLFD